MSCSDSTEYLGPQTVWSAKSDQEGSAIFHSFRSYDTVTFKKLRISMQMERSSGGLKIRPAIRTSDNGADRGSPILIGSASLSSDGSSYSGAYSDQATALAQKQFVQVGVIAYNNAASLAVEMGSVGLKVDRSN